MKFTKPTLILTIGSILIAILNVYILTRPSFFAVFELPNTGLIGETIGGLTAPIFGLAGFIMVFYSFKAQMHANQIQIQALKEQKEKSEKTDSLNNISILIENLDRKIDLFEYMDSKNTVGGFAPYSKPSTYQYVKIQGSTAINLFINSQSYSYLDNNQFNLIKTEHLADYYYILKYADYISNTISVSELFDVDRLLLQGRIYLLYFTKLKPSLEIIQQKYDQSNKSNKILDEILSLKKNLDLLSSSLNIQHI